MSATGQAIGTAVDEALDGATALLAEPGPRGAREALGPSLRRLAQLRHSWDDRMRVALAGRPSAGKSTLINALLGQELAQTGLSETTKVVTWLRYASAPALRVHGKDGRIRQVEPPTLDRLAGLTSHELGDGTFTDTVDFVGYDYPNHVLRSMDIIDTPGTDSVLELDSANTYRHLGPSENTADALIIVFGRGGAREEDVRLAEHFQRTAEGGDNAVNPMTTVGVLTFVETTDYWDKKPGLIESGELKAVGRAREIADRMMADMNLRRILYDLRPVASKVAEAAGLLDERAFAWLAELADGPVRDDELARMATRASSWNTKAPLPLRARAPLYDMLTGYGIVLACELLRAERVTTLAQLRERLSELSGLAELRRLLAEHFVERSDLIKTIRLIAGARGLVAGQKIALSPRQREILSKAVEPILAMELERVEFAERAVIRDLQDGSLQLSKQEVEELRLVLGDLPGAKLAAERLGMPGAPAAALIARADQRSQYWSGRADHGTYTGATRNACLIVSRSYDHLRAVVAGQPHP